MFESNIHAHLLHVIKMSYNIQKLVNIFVNCFDCCKWSFFLLSMIVEPFCNCWKKAVFSQIVTLVEQNMCGQK